MHTTLPAARNAVRAMQAQLQAHGKSFRLPPLEPTTCCGRGCNGCVWESFYAATAFWLEDAANL